MDLPAVDESPVPARVASATLDFERVYDEQVDFVWRSARRLGVAEDEADDVVQRVFLVVHRRLGEFAHRSSIKTWLFGIVLRVVREHQRTVRRKSPHLAMKGPPPDPDALADDAADPFEALSRAEAARLILHLLDGLEQDKREVFVLAELEQMTAPEIAEITGLEPKAVYSRLRAARTDFERATAALRRQWLGRKR